MDGLDDDLPHAATRMGLHDDGSDVSLPLVTEEPRRSFRAMAEADTPRTRHKQRRLDAQ